jgi:hypothetical protein
MNSPVENPEQSEAQRAASIAECERIIAHLYGLCEFGEPATRGACMECDRDRIGLWIVGDFLLCHRCTTRRRRVGEQLLRGAI